MFSGFWCNPKSRFQFEDGIVITLTIRFDFLGFGDGCILSTDCRHRESRDARRDGIRAKVALGRGESFEISRVMP